MGGEPGLQHAAALGDIDMLPLNTLQLTGTEANYDSEHVTSGERGVEADSSERHFSAAHGRISQGHSRSVEAAQNPLTDILPHNTGVQLGPPPPSLHQAEGQSAQTEPLLRRQWWEAWPRQQEPLPGSVHDATSPSQLAVANTQAPPSPTRVALPPAGPHAILPSGLDAETRPASAQVCISFNLS